MKKPFIISYFLIFAVLLALLSLSRPAAEKLRDKSIGLLTPLWEALANVKTRFSRSSHSNESLAAFTHAQGIDFFPLEEIQRLQLENQLLLNQVTDLQALLDEKQCIDHQIQEWQNQEMAGLEESKKELYQKYLQRLKQAVQVKLRSIPAKVIFRSLDTWNSSLWINIGAEHNVSGESPIIAKNSPVLAGDSIVGVIDYVGKRQSRVRLITDNALTPSVRAARGGEQEGQVVEHIDFLLHRLNRAKKLLISEKERDTLTALLATLRSHLQPMKRSWYLAKGELQGCDQTAGRRTGLLLKGTGFNYDFEDEEGEGRDLRTGKLLNNPNSSSVPILKVHDVLITTGMDGVFPPGFRVATVKKIHLLKEGDYYYELEAEPAAGCLDELSRVFVIPPLGYDPTDFKSQ